MFSSLSPTVLLARVLVLCTAIPLHEFAHAWAADKMGDPTARYRQRLSLNPLDHIDPIGALMILFLGIGFARPVPVNSFHFRDRKKGIVITSLAGPFSNVLAALVCLALLKLLYIPFSLLPVNMVFAFIISILDFMVSINITLAVFNLLPIPPLDGWNALAQFLPPSLYWKVVQYDRQMVMVVLMLVLLGVFNPIVRVSSNLLFFVIDKLTFFLDILRIVVL